MTAFLPRLGGGLVAALLSITALAAADPNPPSATVPAPDPRYARDPAQKLDDWYGAQIARYTTDPAFNTPLTDYLPASDTVPTPAKVLGDVSGAPNDLPYVADIHRYFRLLDEASPRVKVFSIGTSEEGREMIAVAIADEALLADLDANGKRLAQLADPRTIDLDDTRANALIEQTTPVYYITAAIHSNETGSPTSVMELAYRLAVDEAPYIQRIRSKVITLITPVVETDGRDRMVDLYRWHVAHPGQQYPDLMYWGHYVAHDNNRDAMGLTLKLSRNVLDTYIGFKAQVLHDLHESVPFLYDNTVGDGPYNAWIDPILVGEWQQIGWDNVQELTRLGLPGVYTHGNFDTWSPGYLMFLAAMHNGVSRLYETFGNGGADTVVRQLDPDEYARSWYKPNPPWPKVTWSQRNNNNYTQSGLLTALNYFADHQQLFLRNFWLKSKRSVQKPQLDGPAAWILPADAARAPAQAALLRVLRAQHVEVHRSTAAFSAVVPADKTVDAKDAQKDEAKPATKTTRSFPAGSYVIRMDQPYSRIADTLLDRQYWAPDDPQKHPYDDTAWSLSELYGTEAVRVLDPAVLKTKLELMDQIDAPLAGVQGNGDTWLVEAGGGSTQIGLAYALGGDNREVQVADAQFSVGKRSYAAGTLVVTGADRAAVDAAARKSDLSAVAVSALPKGIATRTLKLPRIALMHTWLSTQTEGWWRMALDRSGIPYDYISTQDVAGWTDLRSRYDVILFGPTDSGSTRLIVDGLPMWGNAMPWQKTELTPNLGSPDATDDVRPGLGEAGVSQLKQFVRGGGLLLTSGDTAQFAIDIGLAPGVKQVDGEDARVVGSILSAQVVDNASPVLHGYSDTFGVYSPDATTFALSQLVAGGNHLPNAKSHKRPTGRGRADEIDTPQGRAAIEVPELADPKPWEAQELTEEQARNNPLVIPAALRPRALLRFGPSDGLLRSGLLDDASAIAEKPIVVQAPYGQGNTLLFGINPLWRGQTVGSYGLVFNAILNWQNLGGVAR